DKAPVGERLELQALCHVYGKLSADKAYGPVYKCYTVSDGGFLLEFSYAEGLYSDGELTGFEIAGEDRVYYPAKAEIRGDKVFVKSDKVKTPKYVRYQWVNYGKATLFGKNKIPASPFRTSRDDVIPAILSEKEKNK
ncbi:MAG: hypothetical protein SOU50_09530, partial [Oscillospiraceae bacterium]|nr:hypothetical protein [Oscillospiraceae bacterium]